MKGCKNSQARDSGGICVQCFKISTILPAVVYTCRGVLVHAIIQLLELLVQWENA